MWFTMLRQLSAVPRSRRSLDESLNTADVTSSPSGRVQVVTSVSVLYDEVARLHLQHEVLPIFRCKSKNLIFRHRLLCAPTSRTASSALLRSNQHIRWKHARRRSCSTWSSHLDSRRISATAFDAFGRSGISARSIALGHSRRGGTTGVDWPRWTVRELQLWMDILCLDEPRSRR